MKYIKCTLILFLCAISIATLGVKAKEYVISNITIPSLKGTWISGQKDKTSNSIQQIKKTKCVDNVSGDGRVILARTYSMLDPAGYSTWIEVPYSYANWGGETDHIGSFKLSLQSNKLLPTTATFSGSWTY